MVNEYFERLGLNIELNEKMKIFLNYIRGRLIVYQRPVKESLPEIDI